ncbi:MFS transporter [Streptomyces sp. NPDC005496]|uniref:MFS transporter n=2 Tax=Streptomyces TaxID=1883 RepID=UPI0033B24DE8
MKTFIQRTFSSLRGPARTLGALHFADSLGNGLFMAGSAVYFVSVAGLPATVVGLGLSLAGLSGFAASLLFGRLSDRVGARRLLAVLLLLLAGAYALYPAVHSPAAYFPVVVVTGALEYGCGPAFGALIAELVPEGERVTARAALRSLFNAGFSAGALAAAALISLGQDALRLLPLGNGLTFLLAAALVLKLPPTPTPTPTPTTSTGGKGGKGGRGFGVLRDGPFLAVIGASSLLALHSAVLLAGIPLWIVRTTSLPHGVVPLILAVNTVLVVCFQVAAARGSENLDGAVGAARRAGLVSVLACAALAAGTLTGSVGTGVLALAAVLLFTLAELWQSASGFGLGFALAPEQARGEYLGAFHLHVVIQATLGPALVCFLVLGHTSLGWLALAAFFLAGTAAIGPAVTAARRNLPTPPDPTTPQPTAPTAHAEPTAPTAHTEPTEAAGSAEPAGAAAHAGPAPQPRTT